MKSCFGLEHDIFQDLHNFQFRKRAYGVRQKMSEMARLQLGQANLLVAKGDFKQAADICMEVVKEGSFFITQKIV